MYSIAETTLRVKVRLYHGCFLPERDNEAECAAVLLVVLAAVLIGM